MHMLQQDLPRSFPGIESLHSGHKARVLRQVLETYVCYRPDIGYVQGMSYLASILVFHIDDACQAFTCFANLLNSHFGFNLYRLDREQIGQHVAAFDVLFSRRLPALATHFADNLVGSDLFFLEWSMTLFCKLLPLHIVCRVWDSFFFYGEVYCVRVSLAFLKMHKSDLLGLDMGEIVRFSHEKATELDEARFFEVVESIVISESEFDAVLTDVAGAGPAAAQPDSA